MFVIAAPGSGAARLARWLARRPLRNARIAAIEALVGPDWRARDDRWPEIDTAELRRRLATLRHQFPRLARIEHDPRLTLNVTRVAEWFPQAKFVFLYRDARECLASALMRWQTARRPHPSGVCLANGQAWVGPLPPGWSRWTRRPLPEVVAWQWAATTTRALDALDALPADRWCVASFDRLLTDADREDRRLRGFLGLRSTSTDVPAFAQADETSPDPRLWRPYAEALTPEVLKLAAPAADRAVRLFAEAPRTRVRR